MKQTNTYKLICNFGIIALLFVSMNLYSQQTEIQLDSTLINISILTGNHPAIAWLVEHAADTINRTRIGPDGKSAYEIKRKGIQPYNC